MAKVVAVRYIGKSPVYNMEVQDTHDFVTADGVVLHNCFDETKYFLQANPLGGKVPELPRIWTPPPIKPLEESWRR